MKTLFYIVLAIYIVGCNARSEKSHSPADSLLLAAPKPLPKHEFDYLYNAVAHYFDSSLLHTGFNGGFLVAKNGNIIFEQYIGYKDLRTKDTLTKETSLHIASTSKTFTGTAILKLIEEGRLKLDDSLTAFFPNIAYRGVTVKMLLTHRSGLPNYLYYFEKNGWDKKKFLTNRDVLQSLHSIQPGASYKPDTRFNYCNTNYVLLALIIEKVTGIPYPEYMSSKFFVPLQMNHTKVYMPADSATAIPSFDWNNNYWQPDCFDLTYGDKNIYSTPEDLLKWDQALYNEAFISKEILAAAYTPYSNESLSVHNYGLGWRLLLLPNGKRVIYHHGRWHGFNSIFARLVDENATIIILGNRFNRNIYQARRMYNIFGDYQQTISAPAEEETSSNTQTKKRPAAKSKAATKKASKKR